MIVWPAFPYDSFDGGDGDAWDSASVIDSLSKSTHPEGIVSLANVFFSRPPMQILDALGVSLNLQTLKIFLAYEYSDDAYEQVRDQPQFRDMVELIKPCSF